MRVPEHRDIQSFVSHPHRLTVLYCARIFHGVACNYLEHIDEFTVADSL